MISINCLVGKKLSTNNTVFIHVTLGHSARNFMHLEN